MGEKKLKAKVLTWRASIAESDLPRTTRAVAWALANYMNERGESAFPGVPRLCRDVGNERGDGPASKSTVIEALRRLQDAGYLVRAARGGGRSKRGEWHAQLPERVQQLHRNAADAGPRPGGDSIAVSDATAASDTARGAASTETERVQPLHPLDAAERVQSPHERVQLAAVKGAVTAPEVEVQEVDQEIGQQQPRAREAEDAAAADLHLALEELKLSGRDRAAALADPERASAWIQVAVAEAKRNPAAFFLTGFKEGGWPSPRIRRAEPEPLTRIQRLQHSIEEHVFEARADADEIRYFIDVEWDALSSDERAELHEYLERMLSISMPQPAAKGAPAAARAVDAA